MKHSDSLANLAPALVKAQLEIKGVAKDGKNPHFKSTFATLDALIDATRPILNRHGIAVVQGGATPHTDEAGHVMAITVETMLVHSSGEWLSNGVAMPLPKQDPQGAGSAITYGRRYSLSALLSISNDEDDDGNAATPERTAYPNAPPVHRPSGNGSGPTMPMGKTKGTPLSKLTDQEISSALAWAKEKGKFEEFQRDAQVELDRRGALVGVGNEYQSSDHDESLPF